MAKESKSDPSPNHGDGKTISNVRVGKPQARQAASSHQRGVKEGNARGNLEREPGLHANSDGAHATARRSTSINPESHDPIDPRMPNLPPS
jgi:hypothetical protein